MSARVHSGRVDSSLRLTRFKEVPGTTYGTPKEVWGFSLAGGSGSPTRIAWSALHANAETLGLAGVQLDRRKVIHSRAAFHLIYSQEHLGARIHRAYVTVHMTEGHEIYLVKNRAVPAEHLPRHKTAKLDVSRTRVIALRSAGRGGGARVLGPPETVWFPLRTKLHLAHKWRVHVQHPRREWLIYVDANSGSVLSKFDNLSLATGRALVFDPNPVVALGDWHPLLAGDAPVRRVPSEAYSPRALRGITASGLLNGARVTTAPTRHRLRRPGGNFQVRSHERGFEEVMVYFHLDRAIRYLESLGYRATRRIFREPLPVNARGTREDNSWYSPGTRSLCFGTGGVDDAEDGETILHEFGHAIQDAICPDFGQSLQAEAMGEGFGDYFAASFFADKKQTRQGRRLLPAVMTWDGITFADQDERRPPCVRRLDGGRTFESFNFSRTADPHDNGEIWSATLWDIWRAVGRAAADAVIIESHFQLDGFTTFARGARAILDADRHLFGSAHAAALRRIFRRRGIGPVE